MSLDVNPVGKGYALWLAPAEPMFSLLAGQIARLARECSTSQFDPHVTLLGGITLSEEEALARSAALALGLRRFRVELGDMGYSDEYFRCLFVNVLPRESILNARQAVCEAFGIRNDGPYTPHISLVYGKLPLETRERIASGLEPLPGRQFDVSSLALWQVRGSPQEWKLIKEFDLR